MDMEVMAREAEEVFSACVGELKTAGQLPAGSVVVLRCSTSEVAGAKIGKGSVPELGAVIARAMIAACAKHGLRAAFQCCEHLNRAVVMEREVLKEYGCVQVRAIPQPKAGGSVPAAAWKQLREPVLAQAIQADDSDRRRRHAGRDAHSSRSGASARSVPTSRQRESCSGLLPSPLHWRRTRCIRIIKCCERGKPALKSVLFPSRAHPFPLNFLASSFEVLGRM